MRHAALLLFLVPLCTAKDIEDDDFNIVRPETYKKSKPPSAEVLQEMTDENVIPEEPGQIEYVEYIIDDLDDDNDESDSSSYEEPEEIEEKDIQETGRSSKKLFDLLGQIMADYDDYVDYDSPARAKQDFQRRLKDEDQMKKVEDISPAELRKAQNEVPRLAIDPPRPPLPEFSTDKLPETGSKDISVVPVLVRETYAEKESMLIPSNISINIDISRLLLIALTGLLLFWVLRKAFKCYHRPRPTTCQITEEGSVHKVPLE